MWVRFQQAAARAVASPPLSAAPCRSRARVRWVEGRGTTPRIEMRASSRQCKMETVENLVHSRHRAAALVRRALQILNGRIWALPTWVHAAWARKTWVPETRLLAMCNRSAACPSLLLATAADTGHSRRPPAARHREADLIADRARLRRAAAMAVTGIGLRRVRPVQWVRGATVRTPAGAATGVDPPPPVHSWI